MSHRLFAGLLNNHMHTSHTSQYTLLSFDCAISQS